MPANLTPDYLKAEKWFKEAATDEEKILALEEMMRVIPKHKGTEKLQADLRRRLSKLKDSAAKAKKTSHGPDIFHIPKSGAGQVVLLGLPNSGKSAIVSAMTHAKAEVADFPFATSVPIPGMAQFEDIKIELVDMPPITAEYSAPGIVNTFRNCDLVGIVIDLSGDITQQVRVCLDFLESHKLFPDTNNPSYNTGGNSLARKCFVIAAKKDAAPPDAIDILRKQIARPIEIAAISVNDRASLDKMLADIFRLLDIVRIYSKKPGCEPDMKEPFVLPKGSTVSDLANAVHRELAEKLKTARCWGAGVHDGQNVHKTHILCDKDIIELHFA
jgi:ribosome-interacting GTPase 1